MRPPKKVVIFYEDFGARAAECARPLAKLDYDEYSLEYRKITHAGHP